VNTTPSFTSAQPIYARELSGVLNAGMLASTTFNHSGGRAELALAAHTIYRVRLNGGFIACGPARTAHGHARLDRLDLSPHLRTGENLLTIEVVSHHSDGFSHANDPGFLQAEIVLAGTVTRFTSPDNRHFTLTTLPHRATEVRRFSFQRGFSEVYDLTAFPPRPLTPVRRSARRLLPRRVPLPTFQLSPFTQLVSGGTFELDATTPEKPYWWETRGHELCKQYPRESWAANPHHAVAAATYTAERPAVAPLAWPLPLAPGRFAVLSLPAELTGFLRLTVRTTGKTVLAASFDELLPESGHANPRRADCVNTIGWTLPAGTHELESIEPNSMKFLQLQCLSGSAEVLLADLRRYEYPLPELAVLLPDPDRMAILRAAAATFAQNSVDYFMDCPSRERAGWLCDSYFTARASLALTGSLDLETAFLENFLLSPPDAHLPEGMFPMCYPADHPDGNFIPQWSLWLVLQLLEYRRRGGDADLVERFRPRVQKLLGFFSRIEREDGLLRALPGWSFIEWSKSNDFQRDLNYPSSFLYGAALAAAAELYDFPGLAARSAAVLAAASAESFDGTFFVDNASRSSTASADTYTPTRNRTEVCQYYAFAFGAATPQTHPALWQTLLTDFGPHRARTGLHSEIHPANMLVGIMLRLDLLTRHGHHDQALAELTEYLLPMAKLTGTLWEHNNPSASCNHGFASHAATFLLRKE